MRNLLVFSLVALCAVLVSSESAMAGGGGNSGGGKGGGKGTAKAAINFTNVDLANDVQIYVRGPGKPFPTNIDTLRAELLLANKNGGKASTGKIFAGDYRVYVADAAMLAAVPAGTPITEADFYAHGGTPPTTITLKGVDIAANVDSAGNVVVQ